MTRWSRAQVRTCEGHFLFSWVKRNTLYLVKSTISSKGQVTVPAEVRDLLGLVAGTSVEFLVREGEVVMRKRRHDGDPIDRIYGKLRFDRPVDALIDEMRGPRPRSERANRMRAARPRSRKK